MKKSRAFTLAESIIAMLIVAIVAIGGLSSDAMLRFKLKEEILDKYLAVSLATSQIEDLKANNATYYDDPELAEANNPHGPTPNIAGVIPTGFALGYNVEDRVDWTEDGTDGGDLNGPEYKIITVTCTYPPSKTLQLTDYIVKLE